MKTATREQVINRMVKPTWPAPLSAAVVQQLRKKIDGVSELFTLDACRHVQHPMKTKAAQNFQMTGGINFQMRAKFA